MAGIGKSFDSLAREKISNAQTLALEAVKTAKAELLQFQAQKLEGHYQNPSAPIEASQELSFAHSKIANILQRFFGNYDNQTIEKLLKILGKIEWILGDDGKIFRFTNIIFCKKCFGQSLIFLPFIGLGEKFLTTSLRNQIVTLIHEPCHIIGLNFLAKEYYENEIFGLSTKKALNNADSIAIFVYSFSKSPKIELAN